VITPDDAVSPMDAASTLQIPRAVVAALDTGAQDTTMVISAGVASGQVTAQPAPAPVPTPAPVPEPMITHSGDLVAPPARVPEPAEEAPQPRDLGGLVPTVHQPGTQRSLLSRRLDGQ
jgi:hypothetical protein